MLGLVAWQADVLGPVIEHMGGNFTRGLHPLCTHIVVRREAHVCSGEPTGWANDEGLTRPGLHMLAWQLSDESGGAVPRVVAERMLKPREGEEADSEEKAEVSCHFVTFTSRRGGLAEDEVLSVAWTAAGLSGVPHLPAQGRRRAAERPFPRTRGQRGLPHRLVQVSCRRPPESLGGAVAEGVAWPRWVVVWHVGRRGTRLEEDLPGVHVMEDDGKFEGLVVQPISARTALEALQLTDAGGRGKADEALKGEVVQLDWTLQVGDQKMMTL